MIFISALIKKAQAGIVAKNMYNCEFMVEKDRNQPGSAIQAETECYLREESAFMGNTNDNKKGFFDVKLQPLL